MNVPNLLSVFRLFVTVFFVIAVDQGKFTLALYLFIVQGVSDLLDGFFARVMGKKTNLGAFLDPIADKTMLVSAYIVLCLQRIIPFWLTSVVLIRDLILSLGFLYLYKFSYRVKLAPSIWGKITTVAQIVTVVYVLWSEVRDYQTFVFGITALFTIISGCHYMARGFRILLRKDRIVPES
jgi:cardiolipin synthase (CMP-forming)